MTAIYRTTGTLTGTIEADNVGLAQDYLRQDNMAQYLDEPLRSAVVRLEWNLHNDGHNYHVEAICNRELTEDELSDLSDEVSGQNSDGLGEGFEQQDFAEITTEDANYFDDDETDAEYSMISFDWKTNKLPWTRVN
jgi:hypothetical protein